MYTHVNTVIIEFSGFPRFNKNKTLKLLKREMRDIFKRELFYGMKSEDKVM